VTEPTTRTGAGEDPDADATGDLRRADQRHGGDHGCGLELLFDQQ